MSLHGYHYGIRLSALDPPFESLIMAAMRKADTDNSDKLQSAFPELWRELKARYNAPGGIIPEDQVQDVDAVMRNIEEFRRQKL